MALRTVNASSDGSSSTRRANPPELIVELNVAWQSPGMTPARQTTMGLGGQQRRGQRPRPSTAWAANKCAPVLEPPT